MTFDLIAHLLVFLEALEKEDVDSLEVINLRVAVKLLTNLGADRRRREVDSVELDNSKSCVSPVPD